MKKLKKAYRYIGGNLRELCYLFFPIALALRRMVY